MTSCARPMNRRRKEVREKGRDDFLRPTTPARRVAEWHFRPCGKQKTPVNPGFGNVPLFYEAAALTAELRRQERTEQSGCVSFTNPPGTTHRRYFACIECIRRRQSVAPDAGSAVAVCNCTTFGWGFGAATRWTATQGWSYLFSCRKHRSEFMLVTGQGPRSLDSGRPLFGFSGPSFSLYNGPTKPRLGRRVNMLPPAIIAPAAICAHVSGVRTDESCDLATMTSMSHICELQFASTRP
jgi:hypothetical protein